MYTFSTNKFQKQFSNLSKKNEKNETYNPQDNAFIGDQNEEQIY